MALRYFTPVIQKIHSIKEENGFSYWDTETDRGACRFTVRMGGRERLCHREGPVSRHRSGRQSL